MDPLQEYNMLLNIFIDVSNSFETLSKEDMVSYKSLLVRAQALAEYYEKKDILKFTTLRDYLEFFNSIMNNKSRVIKNNLPLVEHGTIAGNQAALLGTAKGFIQRCPECTFPCQRCKC